MVMIHTCIPTYVRTYVRTTYIRTYYVHTYVLRTYVRTTYIRTYVHTYIRTYVHTYIRTYIHTYIHTCILAGRNLMPLWIHVQHLSRGLPTVLPDVGPLLHGGWQLFVCVGVAQQKVSRTSSCSHTHSELHGFKLSPCGKTTVDGGCLAPP